MPDKWGHDQLANDLADHLTGPERMIWTDLIMGSAGNCRPDIFSLRKSFTAPDSRAYEIKISVSDFRSDITSGKWRKYLKYASSVTFCVPKGLITKNDLPNGCGLMTRSEKGWRTAKAPTRQVMPDLPQDVFMKLLMAGIEQERSIVRAKQEYQYFDYIAAKNQFAEDVQLVLCDISRARSLASQIEAMARATKDTADKAVEEKITRAMKSIELRKRTLDTAFSEYTELFGFRLESWRGLREHIDHLKDRCDADSEVARLKTELRKMQSILNKAIDSTEEAA